MARTKTKTLKPKTDHSPEFYERNRDDMSMWSSTPTKADVTPSNMVVFSIRLPVSELEMIRGHAARSGTTISQLVRRAVGDALQAPRYVVGSGESTRNVFRATVSGVEPSRQTLTV